MKYVLHYQSAPDVAQKAPAYGAAHRAYWEAFLSTGTLLMIGPFADLVTRACLRSTLMRIFCRTYFWPAVA
jgi:uncharacterized protein YciI